MNWLKVSLERPEKIRVFEPAGPAMSSLLESPLMAASGHSVVKSTLNRISFICCIMLFFSLKACAQNDNEMLETVRANAVAIFLEQASFTLPDSFHKSGLAAPDKERLIEQWAEASGACLSDALAEYAKTTDVPLSEMVDEDGSFGLKGEGSRTGFKLELDTCIERAWEAVGASLQ